MKWVFFFSKHCTGLCSSPLSLEYGYLPTEIKQVQFSRPTVVSCNINISKLFCIFKH